MVKTPSEYTYLLFWAELSRLLGEKNPCCYSGAGTWDPWSVVKRFNHLATKYYEYSSCDRSDGITPSHAYQEHDSNNQISGTPDGLVINRTSHRSICCQMMVRFLEVRKSRLKLQEQWQMVLSTPDGWNLCWGYNDSIIEPSGQLDQTKSSGQCNEILTYRKFVNTFCGFV